MIHHVLGLRNCFIGDRYKDSLAERGENYYFIEFNVYIKTQRATLAKQTSSRKSLRTSFTQQHTQKQSHKTQAQGIPITRNRKKSQGRKQYIMLILSI